MAQPEKHFGGGGKIPGGVTAPVRVTVLGGNSEEGGVWRYWFIIIKNKPSTKNRIKRLLIVRQIHTYKTVKVAMKIIIKGYQTWITMNQSLSLYIPILTGSLFNLNQITKQHT